MKEGMGLFDNEEPVDTEQYVIEKPHTDLAKIGEVTVSEAWANALVITSVDERNSAIIEGRKCKALSKLISEWFADSKKKAYDTWKAIVAQEKSLTDRLVSVERDVKTACGKFDREQAAIRQQKQDLLQAEAERKARVERERLEKEAAKLKTPELKAERLAEAAQVVAPVIEAAPIEKAAGTHVSKTWDVELEDKGKLVQAAANGNALALSFLRFDASAARKTSVATKGQVPVPGVRFFEKTTQVWR